MNEAELVHKAEMMLHQGRMHGSLTFRMCVLNRDWEAVQRMAPQQKDAMHGVSSLTSDDWRYLNAEAAKDGVTLE